METVERSRPFTCLVCLKSFLLKHHLKFHALSHSNDKPFTCSLCNTSFKRKENIKQHEQSHLQKREFKCEFCKSSFKRYQNLRDHHKRIHKGGPKNVCTLCKEDFTSKQQMYKHKSIMHRNDSFVCMFCEEYVANLSGLRNHLLVHVRRQPLKCMVCDTNVNYKYSDKLINHLISKHSSSDELYTKSIIQFHEYQLVPECTLGENDGLNNEKLLLLAEIIPIAIEESFIQVKRYIDGDSKNPIKFNIIRTLDETQYGSNIFLLADIIDFLPSIKQMDFMAYLFDISKLYVIYIALMNDLKANCVSFKSITKEDIIFRNNLIFIKEKLNDIELMLKNKRLIDIFYFVFGILKAVLNKTKFIKNLKIDFKSIFYLVSDNSYLFIFPNIKCSMRQISSIEVKLKCNFCDANFQSMYEFLYHKKEHFACYICNKSYESNEKFFKHRRETHFINSKVMKNTELVKIVYICLKCEGSFDDKERFKLHECM